MKLSLIIPCFNEEENIRPFYNACREAFAEKITDYELIFINDGSKDRTWAKIKTLFEEEKDARIKAINFSRNFGKESGIYAGLQNAVGDYITIIDADLQQKPEIVVEMVGFLEEHDEYDSVAAYQSKRIEGRRMSIFKRAFYRLINRISDTDFRSDASDFRTFRRGVGDAILKMPEYYRFSKGLFSWVGFETYYMPYVPEERNAGRTSWSNRGLFRYAINGIMSFSVFPLKIATYVGGICAVASLVYMVVVIIQKLAFGIDVPGYATVVVLILLIGGIELMTLGIVGAYIARIYIQGKNRPVYIEKEFLSYEEDKGSD